MGAISGRDMICKKIADALGIKHCRWLQIDMHIDEIITVKAEFYPEIDGVKQLDTIFKQYELVEKKPLKDIAKTEPPIGIDGEPINLMKRILKESL